MNCFSAPVSARRAAWLLAGRTGDGPPPIPSHAPPDEQERLELVDGIAESMRDLADPMDMAVCVRLLEHLCGPLWREPATLWLQ